ncbi:DNA polymerase III subunit beta [Candidatus Beckwithbacteria bacterium]|nr:DNA polymerase III subunit beta [Candidatus Beckwithbacteria bacterium]
MKLIINQVDFSRCLQTVNNTSKNPNHPTLSGSILLQISKDVLVMRSTDFTSSTQVKVKSRVDKYEQDESFVINGGQLFDYVQTLGEGDMELQKKNDKLLVFQKGSRASFSLGSDKDFPKFSLSGKGGGVGIKSEVFVDAIRKASIASSIDESRPVLTGLLLQNKKGKLGIVGTDGYRLSLIELKIGGGEDFSFIVPAKAILSFVRGVEGDELVFGYDPKGGQAWFERGETLIAIRVINGDFPDYEKIMPKTEGGLLQIGGEDLQNAIRQIAVFARQSANIMVWELDKQLQIYTQESALGQSEVLMESKFRGEKIKIAFNFRYFLEYLGVAGKEGVTISFNGPLAPAKITSEADPNFIHIIMPVKAS